MHKVKIKKVSGKNNYPVDFEGQALSLPEVGRGMIVLGDTDSVYTTEVKNVETMGNEYRFNTLNSTYQLEVLDK